MDQPHILLPLSSPTPPPPTSPNPKIVTTLCNNSSLSPSPSSPPTPLRLATILTLLSLSLWANYEGSKGFDLTILNATTRTLTGRRFNLLFVSNGRAADMALRSSHFIEHLLYPEEKAFPRKLVRHVTIRLADRNITNNGVLVSRCENRASVPNGEYIIEISPSVMMQKDVITTAVASALHRGIAYVWLWDSNSAIPQPIIDGMIEYLSVRYKLPSEENESTRLASTLAGLIQLCEERSTGFIARLNNAMRENHWDEHAFSSPFEMMCFSRIISASEEDGLLADSAVLDLELNQAM